MKYSFSYPNQFLKSMIVKVSIQIIAVKMMINAVVCSLLGIKKATRLSCFSMFVVCFLF